MPAEFQRYLEGWRRLMPDYEFRLWDMEAMSQCDSKFFRAAVASGKYAFASDYVRIYALYKFGGIYLDCDVEVLKSFDELLPLPYFICREETKHGIEAAVIGAGKGCRWIGDCLDFYNRRESVSCEVMPSVLKRVLLGRGYQFKEIAAPDEFSFKPGEINLLSSEYFSPKSYVTNEIRITANTFCVHHFSGSWQPRWKKLLLKFWVPFSYRYPAIARMLKR